MKTKIKTSGFFLILGLMGFISQGCSENLNGSASEEFAEIIAVNSDGSTHLSLSSLSAVVFNQLPYEDSELEILLHMKEEEKLARDVYTTLYGKWKVPIFSNISNAESTHMEAVIFLLKNYGEEYIKVNDPGSFSDPKFRELYEQLTSKGSESLEEAYRAGALIEEMDIKDLSDHLKVVTNENIKMVFENLRKGSRNHLRAFNRHLVFLGETYIPQYIDQDEFNQIINSPHETGNRYRMRGRTGL
jgi:hypothetical protein